MSLKDDFNREFDPVLEELSLPERLAGRCRPESCLLCREGQEVWLLRDQSDRQLILKIDRSGERDLAGEFALMGRLPPGAGGQGAPARGLLRGGRDPVSAAHLSAGPPFVGGLDAG